MKRLDYTAAITGMPVCIGGLPNPCDEVGLVWRQRGDLVTPKGALIGHMDLNLACTLSLYDCGGGPNKGCVALNCYPGDGTIRLAD
jgi:hypothetical protein